MNSLTLRAVLAELKTHTGRFVSGVAALNRWEVAVAWEGGGGFLVGADPEHNTLYALDPVPDPETKTSFAGNLGRTLSGTRLAGTRQLGLDRVAVLTFERRDRLGDTVQFHLVAELIGNSANLVLIEGTDPWNGTVRDRLRDMGGSRSRVKTGTTYRSPDPTKVDASTQPPEELEKALLAAGETPGPETMLAAWSGVSPLIARELWTRSGNTTDPRILTRTWIELVESTAPPQGQDASIVTMDDLAEVLCFKAESTSGNQQESCASISLALSKAHRLQQTNRTARAGSPFARAIRQTMGRVERAFLALDEEEHAIGGALDIRRLGEALLASAHSISRGAKSAKIIDPRTGEPRTVRLNPKLSPSANAELYFKKAKKAERKKEHLDPRRKELETRKKQLEALTGRLAALGSEGPDGDWLLEARSLGVPLPRAELQKASGLQPEERLPSAVRPRRYDMGGGWELLVGRSNRGNDILTHEIARPHEVWMHADQAAGSHAVLRHHEKGKEPSMSVLLAAAAITAYYSKARNSGKVPVIVSKKKHVRRPRKAPVGTVTVGEHETLMVGPVNPDDKDP